MNQIKTALGFQALVVEFIQKIHKNMLMEKKFEPDVSDELLDLVDSQDQVVGTMMRSEAFSQGKNNYRAVHAIITNAEGKLLIPRRSYQKKTRPGALQCVGGCVRSGESYDAALIREIYEEITLDLNIHPFQFLGKLTPEADRSAGYVGIYKIEVELNTRLIFNEDDFSDIYWLFPQQLYAKIEQGENTVTNLPILLNKFLPRL